MATWLAAAALALAPVALLAQETEEERDRGFLTAFIEDSLTADGRVVRIDGFRGALSSRATIERLTISDAEGVWLTISDAAISWNRTALLRGRIEMGELTATSIDVARPPVPPDRGLPDAAAEPFQLPELPVSVRIDQISATQVTLGEGFLGEPVTLSLSGGVVLDGGEGTAELEVVRTDGAGGSLTLDAAFDNATEELTLALALQEPPGGIAARLIGLPGEPAVSLVVDGAGPLSDFDAQISLATDGEERLAGSVALREDALEVAPGQDPSASPPPARRFALDIAGDIAPLFLPEYREFFGPRIRLVAAGQRVPGGRTELSELRLEAASITLDGNLTLAADGLPDSFTLAGVIADPAGGAVRLPIGGEPVLVDAARIDVAFNASTGEDWDGAAQIEGLQIGDDRIGRAVLRLAGEIGRDPEGDEGRRVAARVSFEARQIALSDPGLDEALGGSFDGRATIAWREGQPIEFSNAVFETQTARAAVTGSLGDLADGLRLTVLGSADIADLSPLSTLVGQPLAGRVVVNLNGETRLLDGRFDMRASGVGRDLRTGVDVLDRLIAGESRITIDARRDETGIILRQFEATTAEVAIGAAGLIQAGETALEATARIAEAQRVTPGLSGPIEVQAEIRQAGPTLYDVVASGLAPGGAEFRFDGQVDADPATGLAADGRLAAQVADLAAWSQVAGQPLRGSVDATLSGSGALEEDRFDLEIAATATNLGLGIAVVDRLIGPRATLSASAAREGDTTTIRSIELDTQEVTASLSGVVGRNDGQLSGTARLRNAGVFAPDFPGAVDLAGDLARVADGSWRVDLRAGGPGNTTATVTGSIAEDFGSVDLGLAGEAPLGFLNTAIAPRAVQGRAAFDLRMAGAPSLAALSGRIGTANARLVAPTLGVAIGGIGGAVTLSGGRAAVDLSGQVEGGGSVAVSGSIGVEAPFTSDLGIRLASARLRDAELYETTVSGDMRLTGPLGAGGLLSGALLLGPTEIRVAPTGAGAGGEIEGLRHVNEPAAVRETRRRAGFNGGNGAGANGGGGGLGLDLTITAATQVFVRGRGLDAELGGSLRLTGTTTDVIPIGAFDLIRGRLDILGTRLVLDEGSARLEGSFDPYLRLAASTQADGITARVVVEGFASEPEIRFESSPELPEDEVLARLLFGRRLDQLSPLQAAQLASAVATLAGRGGGGIVGNLRENFGLDDLDITTGEDGGAAVRAGRYISENVYTEVTVGARGEADISINLDVSRSVTVRGRVGSDGETGLGVFFERDY